MYSWEFLQTAVGVSKFILDWTLQQCFQAMHGISEFIRCCLYQQFFYDSFCKSMCKFHRKNLVPEGNATTNTICNKNEWSLSPETIRGLLLFKVLGDSYPLDTLPSIAGLSLNLFWEGSISSVENYHRVQIFPYRSGIFRNFGGCSRTAMS